MPQEDPQEQMREALKRVAVALKQTGLPFALTGGYAAWARGAPEPDHDVDFLVARSDIEQIGERLSAAGLKVVEPPEDWLLKVYTDDAMVDLLFRASSEPVERAMLQSAEEIEVLSVLMPVMPATEVMTHKLNALDEHYCDFSSLLPSARALREQVDWVHVRRQTDSNDFAAAFLFLLDRLGITP